MSYEYNIFWYIYMCVCVAIVFCPTTMLPSCPSLQHIARIGAMGFHHSGRHVWGEVGLLRGFLHAEEPAALGIHTSAGAWRGEDEDRLNATQIVQGSSQQLSFCLFYMFFWT